MLVACMSSESSAKHDYTLQFNDHLPNTEQGLFTSLNAHISA